MELGYYPGCTLKTVASNLEEPAIASMAVLDVNLVELPRWNCCGAVYSLASDDLIRQIAPVRNLIRAQERGFGKLVTLCSFCYHTLKRANLLVKADATKRDTLNSFMDKEADYEGKVEVVHLLEVLRDDIGWGNISGKVKVPLQGLKLAPYYGCTLLRPREVAIDQPEKPTILHHLIEALGATVADFPFSTECCGSYQVMGSRDSVLERALSILGSAMRWGADALVLTCPLCAFNLGQTQSELKRKYRDFNGIPVFYFTQLLALSLGLGSEVCRFELNYGEPQLLMQSKDILPVSR